MFYSTFVLTKKGPLAKIWLAAHMQSRLTKAMVKETDIGFSCAQISHPEAPMALRLSSNLMLGVVRIFSRQTKYLLQESEDAMTKIRLMFRAAPAGPRGGPPIDLAARAAPSADVHQIGPELDLEMMAAAGPAEGLVIAGYKALERDITIEDAGIGLGAGMVDAFALEPEMDRMEDLVYASQTPLIFTPAKARELSESQGQKSADGPWSVERFRDAAAPPPALQPQLRDSESGPDAAEGPPGGSGPVGEPELTPAKLLSLEHEEAAALPPPGTAPAADDDDSPIPFERPAAELEALAQDMMPVDDDGPPPPPATPPPGDPTGDKRAAEDEGDPAAGASPRKRKRRRVGGAGDGAASAVDKETELSSGAIRRGLADTSDIVLTASPPVPGGGMGGREELGRLAPPKKRARGRPEVAALEHLPPGLGLGASEELDEIFREYLQPELVFAAREAPVRPQPDAEDLAHALDDNDDAVVPRASHAAAGAAGAPVPVVDDDDYVPEAREREEEKPRQDGEEEQDQPPISGSPNKSPPEALSLSQQTPAQLSGPSLSPLLAPSASDHLAPIPGSASPVPPAALDAAFPSLPHAGRKITLAMVSSAPATVPENEGEREEGGVNQGEGNHSEVNDSISARTERMIEFIQSSVELAGGRGKEDEERGDGGVGSPSVNFGKAMREEEGMTRRTAARAFYELLNLGNRNLVRLQQEKAYGEILVRPTAKLSELTRVDAVH